MRMRQAPFAEVSCSDLPRSRSLVRQRPMVECHDLLARPGSERGGILGDARLGRVTDARPATVERGNQFVQGETDRIDHRISIPEARC
jgi:hypothetical protein